MVRRWQRVAMIVGLAASAGFGLGQFVVPGQLRCYALVPDAPRALVASAGWTDFLLHLLLCGVSVMLIALRREVLRRERAAVSFYVLLVAVWAGRIAVIAVHPLAYDGMFAAQVAGSAIVTALLAAPLPRLFAPRRGAGFAASSRRWGPRRRDED